MLLDLVDLRENTVREQSAFAGLLAIRVPLELEDPLETTVKMLSPDPPDHPDNQDHPDLQAKMDWMDDLDALGFTKQL